MTNIFIAYSYEKRAEFYNFHKKLKLFLEKQYNSKVYSFVFDFKKKVKHNEMMKKAFIQIKKSDIFIAELSYKEIGIGTESGFAKAQGKKIIYIQKKGAPLSTTVLGISDVHCEYSSLDNLLEQLSNNPKIRKFLSPS